MAAAQQYRGVAPFVRAPAPTGLGGWSEELDEENAELIAEGEGLVDEGASVPLEQEDEGEVGVLFVHNVMAFCQLNCDIDLDVACRALGNSVYNPEEFHSVRVDVRCRTNCIASINIFSNGKMMGTGANSVEELRRTMKKIARRLQRHPLTKYKVSMTRFRVSNILGSYAFASPISLHSLAALRGLHVDYEPERFPGARVKISIPKAVDKSSDSGKEKAATGSAWAAQTGSSSAQSPQDAKGKEEIVTLQLFSTGNVTLTGGRSVESMEYALQCVLPFLQQCQIVNGTS
ncbi:putative TATA-box binding protein [Neospora caninum Liverpool]|uniref:Putative TATA-box binding protein n=1 Tax=Neospora caninum (strain Liverpool) TaxID=572307 RepID=F0VC93_NEOCL|nr:putative TATA-box binding protein [Neospora caninum Liverpool]CBZ51227.1 putative TATA-box binding protein [Neospora caninum Liverpool]CEL68541.1 TPA: TATA-box binding protein, putative [Neospora caninum Liverpool]|eukprot:XP_003881260.1 putative TATA-box binding protein [Neospora caninum Liverpool]